MKFFTKKDKRTVLEKEIDRLLLKMSKMEDQNSEEYKTASERVGKLIEINVKRNQSVDKKKLDPNTLAVVIGGCLEMVIIMTYERTHVIATKAFSRILRGRA